MKKLGLLLMACIFVGSLFSQNDARDQRKQRAIQESERVAQQLNLTEEQIKQKATIDAQLYQELEGIQAKRKTVMEMRQNMKDETATAEDREKTSQMMNDLREEQIKIKQEADKKFMNILTDEQKATYEKMKASKSVKKPVMSK